MDWDFVFTVFTPTYNRGHTLPKLFESLQEQTFEDFEWVIVDDGSTDETADRVKMWQRESKFPIRYFYQENSGKPTATNLGVKNAAGELFLVVDSDDHLPPTALETFWHHWTQIPKEERPNFAGVGGLDADESGKIFGTPYPESPLDAERIEVFQKLGVTGDKKWFVRTEIMKQFPYPVFDGEKHVPPSLVWNRIGKEWKFRFVNEVVCIVEYRSDGITHNLRRTMLANPRGYRLQMQELIEQERDISIPLIKKVSHWGHYWRFSLHGKVGLSQIVNEAPEPSSLMVIGAPLGFLRYLWDKVKVRQWRGEES